MVKRSENKATVGGRKTAVRRHKPTGTATEEIVVLAGRADRRAATTARCSGRSCAPASPWPTCRRWRESREHLRECLISIPWEGLKLSAGDPAIPVTVIPASP